MSSTRARAKVKPYKFTKKIETLTGEKWANINDRYLLGFYKISTFGRVKRLKHTFKGKEYNELILTPYRNLKNDNCKYRLIIRGTNYCVQDLVYSSFKKLKKGYVAVCKDGDRRNICLDNLKQSPSTWKRINSHLRKINKSQKPLFVQINIHDGDKETNLMQIKEMKKDGYCLVTSSNGIYDFKLVPKEGDTVRVVIEGSIIKNNKFVIEHKNRSLYYLKGVDPMNFFIAEELEIIKQA